MPLPHVGPVVALDVVMMTCLESPPEPSLLHELQGRVWAESMCCSMQLCNVQRPGGDAAVWHDAALSPHTVILRSPPTGHTNKHQHAMAMYSQHTRPMPPPSGALHTVLILLRSLLNSITASTDQCSTASGGSAWAPGLQPDKRQGQHSVSTRPLAKRLAASLGNPVHALHHAESYRIREQQQAAGDSSPTAALDCWICLST